MKMWAWTRPCFWCPTGRKPNSFLVTRKAAFVLIPYDDDFRVLTLPTTSKGTTTVFPERGIRMRGLYYWCDSFRDPAIERSMVPVRYDPWDAGTAYAYVRNQWVRCHSEYFVAFQGRPRKRS